MKTLSTLSTAKNEEVTLGWNAMPAYGEVMTTLIGTSHTDVVSTVKLEKPSLLKSFWNTLSNLK